MNLEDFNRVLTTGKNAGLLPVDVFWAKVNVAGHQDCWLWKGQLFPNGYGRFNLRGAQYLAHRAAVLLSQGVLIGKECVRHTCDNPACVNPAHLIEGSQKENIQDAIDRDRLNPQRGEKSSKAKLKLSDVVDIRRRCAAGETQRNVAETYKITPKQVSVIVSGKQWRI